MAAGEQPDDSSSEEFEVSGTVAAAFVPAVSNFSIQYNYACASIATAVMLSDDDVTGRHVHPDFREPRWAKDILLSLVFVGSVVGMLTMGYLGDLLGIRKAILATNSLTVLGALASALLSWGDANTVWTVVALARFVLGVGVGGNYPLSAAKAAESTLRPQKKTTGCRMPYGLDGDLPYVIMLQGPTAAEAAQKAADAFFWQGPGSCAPYLLALLLLCLPSSDYRTSLQFRLLLGVGALPSLVVLLAAARERPSEVPAAAAKGKMRQALANPRHWRTLVGTAGTWFLFDVAFYGMLIFAPVVLSKVFGKGQSLKDMAWHAALMSFLGIVGTLCGVLAVHYVGPKNLNTGGLVLAGLLFATFAVLYHLQGFPYTLFALLCLLYFVLYFSANIATFLLPVVSFPRDVRSTFHGLSAAAAKVGAMLGALLFPIVAHNYGTAAVMLTQAVVCMLGALICHCLVENKSLDDSDESESSDDEADEELS